MPVNPLRKIASLRNSAVQYHCEKSPAQDTRKHFTFGRFGFEHEVHFSNLTITVKSDGGLHQYKRTYKNGENTYEATFSATKGSLLLHPIEPNHKPKSITDFLEIKFKPIVIEPDSECTIFLTFPIEIACLLESETGKAEVLDVVTAARPKFSMYGTSARGVITRYHESEVTYTIPPVKNYKYGVLRLTIKNDTPEWATVGRIVLYMEGLWIYFDESIAGACASMDINAKDVAKTRFENGILCDGMQESVSLFEERKTESFMNTPATLLVDETFTMDMGLI
ncbi:MAG TPA: DUF432 domain-containing protein [Methanocorpusculum sp.]|nr:DUF432 domain-containing protein [Methanocorpusculum sp.]